MRLLLVAALTVLTSSTALAASCDHKGTMVSGVQAGQIHECWDQSAWPADKAKKFCNMFSNVQVEHDADAAVNFENLGSAIVEKCPAGFAARCENATYRAPGAAGMPAEYLAQMPPEVAAQLKANLERMQAPFKEYDGLKTTVYYYADPTGTVTLADQKTDCETGKGGVFKQ